jgi:hypothetical protein
MSKHPRSGLMITAILQIIELATEEGIGKTSSQETEKRLTKETDTEKTENSE